MTARSTKRAPQLRDDRRRLDARLDEALDETFPASDPIAVGKPTGTERPARPVDRKPPLFEMGSATAIKRSRSPSVRTGAQAKPHRSQHKADAD
jgi:hypothetical protein